MTTTEAPAGRDMDALIAERVMGWGWMRRDLPQVLPAHRWLVPPDEYGDWGHVRPADGTEPMEDAWWLAERQPFSDLTIVPHYSTDVAAAWLVVARLMEGRAFMVSVNCSHESGWWAVIYPPSGPHVESEYAPTAALAICRAALAVIHTSSPAPTEAES